MLISQFLVGFALGLGLALLGRALSHSWWAFWAIAGG